MEKKIEKEITVNSGIEEVWNAWTTESGVKTFFAPRAKIKLIEGGEYEMFFIPDAPEGSRGGEGCKVLNFEYPVRFVFSWNFPPSIPSLRETGAKTEVEIKLEKVDDSVTKVILAHTGWRKGEDWNRGYDYFNAAWEVVLNRLKQRFETGPVSWK